MSFLRTLDVQGARLTGQTLDGNFSRDVSGVLVIADDCVIEDCEFKNLDGIAIYVRTGKRLTIRHNKVHDIWRQGIAYTGGDADFSGTLIEYNEISNTGYDSIQIGGSGITVRDNYMSGGAFGGLYALTGSKNFKLIRNVVENAYGGFDLSWGTTGVNRAGTLLSGRVVAENIIKGCVGGISTAGNGTVIRDNEIYDCGKGKQQTYTLLGVVPSVVVAGNGYQVGDLLSLVGGATDFNPAKVLVDAVNASGGVTQIRIAYIGCYYAVPANPIQLVGGSGVGAALQIQQWDKRGFIPHGIGIADASHCIVTGNISGNTNPANKYQKVGCMLSYIFDKPTQNVITGNSFPNNADFPIAGYRRNAYDQTLLAGNLIGFNAL